MRIPVFKTHPVNSEQQANSKVISGVWCYEIPSEGHTATQWRRRGRGGTLTCLCSAWRMNSGSSAAQTSRSAVSISQSPSLRVCPLPSALGRPNVDGRRTCVLGGAGRGARRDRWHGRNALSAATMRCATAALSTPSKLARGPSGVPRVQPSATMWWPRPHPSWGCPKRATGLWPAPPSASRTRAMFLCPRGTIALLVASFASALCGSAAAPEEVVPDQ